MILLEGMGIYLLLCSISLLCGQGIIRLIGLKIEWSSALYLGPILTLVLWTIVLGVGISYGLAVKQLCWVGWLLTAFFMLGGLRKEIFRKWKAEKLLIVAAAILPMAVMFPHFWHGLKSYLGSPFPDGWSYIAYAQYLWEWPKGMEGGLSPLHQYAAHLSGTRYVASGFLGFFTPLTGNPGDTQASSGLFLAWVLFVFSASCLFFAASRQMKGNWALLYAVLCTFSGWVINLLLTNNYDNALAICLLPAFAGMAVVLNPPYWRWSMVLGAVTAAALYCYPEMAVMIIGGAFLFLIHRLAMDRMMKQGSLLLFFSLALSAVLVAPFFADLINFLRSQVSISLNNPGVRPGEGFFAELLTPWDGIWAFWGFGTGSSAGLVLHRALALALSFLTLLGIYRLFRNREWGLLASISLLLVGAMAMIFHFHYSYGAYKFILLNWWGMSFAVIMGVAFLQSQSKKVLGGIGALFLIIFIVHGVRIASLDKKVGMSLNPFKEVEKVQYLIDNHPVLAAIDNDLANEWAVYFLRKVPLHLAYYRVYMAQPHVIPYMNRAKAIDPSKVGYILTDRIEFLSFPPDQAVWSGGPYFLWEVKGKNWVLIGHIKNENGLETWGGEPGFWIGKGETEISLYSSQEGEAALEAFFIRGPSSPEKKTRTLLVLSGGGYKEVLTFHQDELLRMKIPVLPGQNRVILRALDKPTLLILPSGDSRPMLVGIRGLRAGLIAKGPIRP